MMGKRIIVVPIEPVETRYTWEWYDHVPGVLIDAGFDVYRVDAIMDPPKAETSDFLNWTATNIYKSRQIEIISEWFADGTIKDGDTFLFCDFWHPGVLQVKYMAVMLGINIRIVGLAHAGAYDGWDRLAIKSWDQGSPTWALQTEQAFKATYDMIVFATEFHRELFEMSHGQSRKNLVAGFPMEYVLDNINNFGRDPLLYKRQNKYRVIFTQRLAPEKQPEKFKELERVMVELYGPQFEFVNMLERYQNPTKKDYYTELMKSDLYVSFALQETLGITPFEALCAGCKVLVPDRLSYKEMWLPDFKYDDNATMVEIADLCMELLTDQVEQPTHNQLALSEQYFASKTLVEILRNV